MPAHPRRPFHVVLIEGLLFGELFVVFIFAPAEEFPDACFICAFI